MAQFTFPLKQDLILPATGNPNKGYLLFPKNQFGLSYEVKPNAKKRILSVILGVAELSTDELIWPLNIYQITDDGFTTSAFYSNQAEYDIYIFQKATIEEELTNLTAEIGQLYNDRESLIDETSQEYIDITDEIILKESQRNDKMDERDSLKEVILEPGIINRYDDVIGYFKGDGSLTEEGIAWAKTVYYNGILLGDLIE
jgi:hypothetical protein